LFLLQHITLQPIAINGSLMYDFRNKRPDGRLVAEPVHLKYVSDGGWEIYPLEYNGPAHINAFAQASGLMLLPDHIAYLPKNTVATVITWQVL